MAPAVDLSNVQSFFGRKSRVLASPTITPQTAALLSILYMVIYVLPFYLSPTTRPSPALNRDAPSVIRARVKAVTLACFACSLITLLVLHNLAHLDIHASIRKLGWWPISFYDIGRTILLVAILFAGPLFEAGIVEEGWKDWITGRYAAEILSTWIGWRNLIVGPATEELLFRSLIIPLHQLSQAPHNPAASTEPGSPDLTTLIFITPLYFGIAHIHHLYEFKLTHSRAPWIQAVALSLFQFTYTTLFGWFAAFLFLRTGSLYPAIAAHTFCNWLGLPRFWGRVGQAAELAVQHRTTPPNIPGPDVGGREATGVRQDDEVGKGDARKYSSHDEQAGGGANSAWTGGMGNQDWGVWATYLYYALLVAGAYGFWRGLYPLTASTNALVLF